MESGQSFVGRVLQRSSTEVVLQVASGKSHSLQANEIELEKPISQSLMPEQLLNSLTPKQAADLLAYLK